MVPEQILYYLSYGFQCFVLGRRKPIVAGVPLTDVCNLHCSHCVVAHAGRGHHSREQVRRWIRLLYERGARILYLQGGEVFTWSDGEARLDDVVRMARAMGYFMVATVTNGTFPIRTEADLVWLSIDGSPAVHDRIRGAGAFEKLSANLAASPHPRIYANMTVNRLNRGETGAVLRFVAGHPKLKGISFNFHTPYPGVEDLALPRAERAEVVDGLLGWKRDGFPIVNSFAGLKRLASGHYRRPVWMIHMVEQGEVFECCWGRKVDGVCRSCGYGVIAELSGLSRLEPASLLGALKLFRSGDPLP
jgi:MoaA/NifB/PqqE/SkfB family radical SAM enzyme